MSNNQKLHFETFAASLAYGLVEYGFTFKEFEDTDDCLFDLVLFRGKRGDHFDEDTLCEEHQALAHAIANNENLAGGELVVMGPTIDTPEHREYQYWSAKEGWVKRSSADAFGVQEALKLLYTQNGASALQIAS